MISDPARGVIANDVRVSGVRCSSRPTSGTVVLNANGTFTYIPDRRLRTATSDCFTYCANGTVTGGVCSSELAR